MTDKTPEPQDKNDTACNCSGQPGSGTTGTQPGGASGEPQAEPVLRGREAVFAKVRAALQDIEIDDPELEPIEWKYNQPLPMEDVLETFIENTADYKAVVVKATQETLADEVAKGLLAYEARNVILPAGIPDSWADAIAAANIPIERDDPQKTSGELNTIHAVVTGSVVGIAETGTIVLNHDEDQGRRALTLVPDIHVCVVNASDVVSDVPEATTILRKSIDRRRPLTWISGPSATSDIELNRVEGVHGPRTLHVIVCLD